jgi:hypothetical protein
VKQDEGSIATREPYTGSVQVQRLKLENYKCHEVILWRCKISLIEGVVGVECLECKSCVAINFHGWSRVVERETRFFG